MAIREIYNIKKLLAVRGRNASWLAERLGSKRTILSDTFRGRCYFSMERLLDIADILEVDVSELFVDEKRWLKDPRTHARHSLFTIMANNGVTAKDISEHICWGYKKTGEVLNGESAVPAEVAKQICEFIGVPYETFSVIFNIDLTKSHLVDIDSYIKSEE